MAETKTAPTKKTAVEFTEDGRRKTLRAPQLKLLAALKKAPNHTLVRSALVEKCPGVGLTEHLGSSKPDAAKNKYTVSLIEQKFVKASVSEEESGILYTATAAGLKALEKATAGK